MNLIFQAVKFQHGLRSHSHWCKIKPTCNTSLIYSYQTLELNYHTLKTDQVIKQTQDSAACERKKTFVNNLKEQLAVENMTEVKSKAQTRYWESFESAAYLYRYFVTERITDQLKIILF